MPSPCGRCRTRQDAAPRERAPPLRACRWRTRAAVHRLRCAHPLSWRYLCAEQLSQLLSRVEHPRFHRVDRTFEELRDLRVGEALEKRQLHHFAMLLGEPAKRVLDA